MPPSRPRVVPRPGWSGTRVFPLSGPLSQTEAPSWFPPPTTTAFFLLHRASPPEARANAPPDPSPGSGLADRAWKTAGPSVEMPPPDLPRACVLAENGCRRGAVAGARSAEVASVASPRRWHSPEKDSACRIRIVIAPSQRREDNRPQGVRDRKVMRRQASRPVSAPVWQDGHSRGAVSHRSWSSISADRR